MSLREEVLIPVIGQGYALGVRDLLLVLPDCSSKWTSGGSRTGAVVNARSGSPESVRARETNGISRW
jgi:hypothetical protein